MRLFFSPNQLLHQPTQYLVHGRIVSPLENANRGETLIKALGGLGLDAEEPGDAGLDAIAAVHASHYLDFLASAHERFQALPNGGPEVLPNVHPYASHASGFSARGAPRTNGILGQAGWYIGDMSCAMTAQTFAAAYASAQSAIAAADAVLSGAASSFALCRPPGHHAYVDRASGFCFLNNAAIAAERLRSRFGRVAILDFDTHHGDGTQAIFYARGDVFFGSTHTDPANYYPHFAGYAEERGIGDGEGCNLNLPLAPGSDDAAFVEAVRTLAEAADRFDAEAIVLSAGWDAHRDDPLSKLAVTTDAFARIGTVLGALGRPTVIVQEGGYSLAAVAEAAPQFVGAFSAAHRLRD
ncbi:histone deacetylase family protein [Mangrovicella endophytica]|uniref:histone deacetylase family protein n=1 Tax=Mangrovicella endophytica TaxID=2066697 RepID=UPI000C9E85BA|nr:histone deacetylase family protein [Mangrovicella endophytica]